MRNDTEITITFKVSKDNYKYYDNLIDEVLNTLDGVAEDLKVEEKEL